METKYPMSENFRYATYLNHRAIIDFLELMNFKNDAIDIRHTYVLSYLVDIYRKPKGIEIYREDGEEYIYVSNYFILKNLKFLGCKKRQLQNIISRLAKIGSIKTKLVNHNTRYIRVNPKLLELWERENWDILPIDYLRRYRPDLWKSIENQWLPIKGQKDFDEVIKWCNGTLIIRHGRYTIRSMVDLIHATMESWNNNEWFNEKTNSI